MSDKQSDLTDKEIEDLQNITADTLASICTMADKHNIDRNSMLKYLADMLTAFAEVASIQNYKFNHTHADRIRNMLDEELAELLFNKSRCDNCFANCNDKDNCPSLGSCYSRHLEWLQSKVE